MKKYDDKPKKSCQIVLVGHSSSKLILSIDKETFNKIILIIESQNLPGSKEARKTLRQLVHYYTQRKVEVLVRELDFHIQTKPIAQLVYLIYQQILLGYPEIVVNISSGLRYMVIWFYLACSITNTKILHADYIYEKNIEVGIHSNIEVIKIPLTNITGKQFEFLKLFFTNYVLELDFFNPSIIFNENLLLTETLTYKSLEDLKKALEEKRNESLTRGSINGYITKLKKALALKIKINPDDRKEKMISISYIGIALFLRRMFNRINSY